MPIDAGAWKAADGNNNGRINVQFFQQGLVPVGSFSSTQVETEPWYDIDLGELTNIEFIDLWNTVELNGPDIEQPSPHFGDFYVLVSDSAFPDTTLAASRALAAHEFHKDSIPTRKFSLNYLGITGQYVRIQAAGTNKLAFAEVEVVGRTYIDSTCIPSPTGMDVVAACDSFTWINGVTYFQSNNQATDTLLTALGCDSVVTLDLTINSLAAQISQIGTELQAGPSGASFQWWDCNANASIPGATDSTYSPNVSGNYAVVVSQNGCVDTSACVNVTIIGLADADLGRSSLFPTPNQGQFILIPRSDMEGAEANVFSSDGRLVERRTVTQGRNAFALDLPAGLYQFVLKKDGRVERLAFTVME